MTTGAFRTLVWKYYRAHGRHNLPWRKTKNAYRILVSEIMLQQTQVHRVLPMYAEFTRRFPTVKKLAKASLADVLKAWQGLGYNRRAKMLHAAAKEIAKRGMPQSAEGLEELPGIGPYTAAAVAAFAWNKDAIVIETNIRTAVIHHFYKNKKKVGDAQVSEILEEALPKGKSREWYSALMDYGAHLKKSGVKLNAKSAGYAKQAKFAGSDREARGAILKELSRGSAAEPRLLGLLGDDRRAQMQAALEALCAEGFIEKKGKNFALAS